MDKCFGWDDLVCRMIMKIVMHELLILILIC